MGASLDASGLAEKNAGRPCATGACSRVEGAQPEGPMTMPTYKSLFLHRSQPGPAPSQDHVPSPEQMQQMLAKWNAWKEKFKDNIVDWGDKLKPGGKI